MSTPNPLAPQGSLLEKHGRGRSTFQIISFIGALHVVALCGMLWIGCKKDDQAGANSTGTTGGLGGYDPGATPGLPPSDPGLPPIGGVGYGIPTNDVALPGAAGGPVAMAVSNPPVAGVGTKEDLDLVCTVFGDPAIRERLHAQFNRGVRQRKRSCRVLQRFGGCRSRLSAR